MAGPYGKTDNGVVTLTALCSLAKHFASGGPNVTFRMTRRTADYVLTCVTAATVTRS